MKRKIVQITSVPGYEDDSPALVALAEDGTLWEGCMRIANKKEVHEASEARRTDPKAGTVKAIYKFIWEPLPTLPDDNGNLTKVR
jgi:hypothetical protein